MRVFPKLLRQESYFFQTEHSLFCKDRTLQHSSWQFTVCKAPLLFWKVKASNFALCLLINLHLYQNTESLYSRLCKIQCLICVFEYEICYCFILQPQMQIEFVNCSWKGCLYCRWTWMVDTGNLRLLSCTAFLNPQCHQTWFRDVLTAFMWCCTSAQKPRYRVYKSWCNFAWM